MMMREIILSSLILLMVSCSKDTVTPTPEPTPKFTISISAGEGGSVSTEGGTYDRGTKVTITATPDGEFLFDKWSDGNSDNPREITVTSNLSISASFVKKKYALVLNIEGEGVVEEEIIVQGSTSTTEYNSGTTIRLTATAGEEWVFFGWSGAIESTDNPIEISVDESKEITATFKLKQYDVTITTEGEGTVTESIVSQPTLYDSGTIIELEANPSEGWEFVEWKGDLNSIENPTQLNVSGSTDITAVFKFVGYSVSRHVISLSIDDFPTINHLTNTVRDISGGFVINTTNNIYFFRSGVTGDESVGSIEEVDPSPSMILKKNDGNWELLKVDKNIFTWVARNYAIDGDIITIGDGNEIGPNEGSNTWKGDVWQGRIDDYGDINWNRVTTDETRSFHHGIATGDLNGDGLIDISSGPGYNDPNTGNRAGQPIWLNNGDGTFQWHIDLIPQDAPAPFGLAFSNVTGDSRDEIILGGNAYGLGSPNYIHIYQLKEDSSGYELFKKLEDDTLWDYGMFTTKIDSYDFNNDGILDLIQYQADESGEGFDIWIGDGAGGFSPHYSKLFPAPTLSSSEFEVFDVNNDGYLDVLLRPNGYNSAFRVNTSEYRTDITNGIILNNLIWLNDGNGRFNAYDQVDLTLNQDIDGKSFHPKYVVPFLEDNELHFLGVEPNFIQVDDKVEFAVYDIKVLFE